MSGQVAGPTNRRLNQDIANAIVRQRKAFLGRGPTRTQAFYRDKLVVVLMEDELTGVERRLAEDGSRDAVLGMRLRYQETMKTDMVQAVEGLTGRTVEAFLSGNHIGPDLAAELFVLDQAIGL